MVRCHITFRAYLKSCEAGFGQSAESTKPDTLCYMTEPKARQENQRFP